MEPASYPDVVVGTKDTPPPRHHIDDETQSMIARENSLIEHPSNSLHVYMVGLHTTQAHDQHRLDSITPSTKVGVSLSYAQALRNETDTKSNVHDMTEHFLGF